MGPPKPTGVSGVFDSLRAQETMKPLTLLTGREEMYPCPYPVEDGQGVPGVGVGEGEDPQQLAEPGLLEFKKPAAGEETEAVQNSHVSVWVISKRFYMASCEPQFLH